eukprot:1995782-Rhodomonas_salina.1
MPVNPAVTLKHSHSCATGLTMRHTQNEYQSSQLSLASVSFDDRPKLPPIEDLDSEPDGRMRTW